MEKALRFLNLDAMPPPYIVWWVVFFPITGPLWVVLTLAVAMGLALREGFLCVAQDLKART